ADAWGEELSLSGTARLPLDRRRRMPRYAIYATPTHLTAENHTSEAASKAPRPMATAEINTKSDSTAPTMPGRAERTPKREPLVSARRTVGPGVAMPTKATIEKRNSV